MITLRSESDSSDVKLVRFTAKQLIHLQSLLQILQDPDINLSMNSRMTYIIRDDAKFLEEVLIHSVL